LLHVRVKQVFTQTELDAILAVDICCRRISQIKSCCLIAEELALVLVVKRNQLTFSIQVALDGAEGQRLGFERSARTVLDGQAFIQNGLVQVLLVLD